MPDDRDHTLDSAREAAGCGRLDRWVRTFLASPGSDNAPLGAQLVARWPCWAGPIRMPIDELARLAGPADHPVVEPVGEDEWRDDVAEMAADVEGGWEPPPVVATFQDGQVVLEDGNHRVEALRQAGREHAWTIVGFVDAADRERFAAEHAGPVADDR